jgi:predicted AAA+ superfamily ATPase
VDSRSRDLKRAIQDLNYAGVIKIVYSTSASGLPLNALINEKKFKLFFLDVGLVNRTMRLTINDLQKQDIIFVNSGAVAEQWVGQELIAYMKPYEEPNIHYWSRDKRGSQAEVDYIITVDSTIVPIEVKAGTTGSLKSLHLLMQERNLPIGVRISQQPLQQHNNILSVPFYLLSELNRLITDNGRLG